MYIYLNKLKKSFPFMIIYFKEYAQFVDININGIVYDSIHYYKYENNWVISNLLIHSTFKIFLDKFIEGLIKYKVY